MAFKQGNGVNNKTVVKSNILRHTDGRLYVGTADGIRSINEDGSNGPLLSNTGSMNPMFTLPHVIIIPGRIAIQSTFAQRSGKKVYELKDHLGNVRAVITDRKFLTLTGTDPKYKAELVTATDYYAYGSPMKGRIYTTQTGSYRFGFNTQEKVDEVSGDGNHNTAEFWEYDTRLGRRWNLDPKSQVNISDYAVMGCNPVFNMDWLGDEVVNGYKRDKEHYKKQSEKFKEKAASHKSKIAQWWYNMRAKRADKKLEEANALYDETQAWIDDYEKNNPEDFKKVNEDIKEVVEVKVVGANEVKGNPPANSSGSGPILSGSFSNYKSGNRMVFKIKIPRAQTKKDKTESELIMRKRFGHEFGHFWFIIKESFKNAEYKEEHYVDPMNGGHGSNPRKDNGVMEENPDGVNAIEWENRTK